MRSLLISVLLLAPVLALAAGERQVAKLDDPPGDDSGNGTLVYPQRDGFSPGDLDLTSLRIARTGDKYRFEATFKNPIRDPATVAGDVGPESLAYFDHHGFFAFNIDLYLDLDRIPGSGNVWTLPGRRVAIAPANAWEKAIVVTPRPELMRKQLADALADRQQAADVEPVAKRLDEAILFVTDVRVRGKVLSFDVPASFLSGGRPDSDWSLVAFVTGAKTSIDADLDTVSSPAGALDRIPLGVMQPRPGQPRDSFGYSGNLAPSPVVDLLAPKPQRQPQLLSAPLAGLTWSASGAAGASGNATPVTSIEAWFPAPTAAGAPSTAITTPGATSSEPVPKGDIAERLRRLDALHAQGLVSDDEYRALRQKILSEL